MTSSSISYSNYYNFKLPVVVGSDRHLNRSELFIGARLLEDDECGVGFCAAAAAAAALMNGCGKGKGGRLPSRLFGEK